MLECRTAAQRVVSAIALTLAIGYVLLPAQARADDRVALVIGNGAYRSAPVLPNPINDAVAMAALLRDLGFDVIEATDQEHQGLLEQMSSFVRKLKGAKIGLFYYAGHAVQVDGSNYLLSVDTNISTTAELAYQTISMNDVFASMESTVDIRLILLDACRTNPFQPRLVRRASARRGLRAGEGLADDGLTTVAASGTVVAFATAPGFVADDGDGAHSPFTEALLKYLPDPTLEIRQVLTRVRAQVVWKTQGYQVPWESSSLTDDVYIAQERSGGSEAPLKSFVKNQYDGWDEIEYGIMKDSTNIEDLKWFLAEYPNSKFAGDIKIKLKNLLVEKRKNLPDNQPLPGDVGKVLPEVIEAGIEEAPSPLKPGSGIVPDLRINFASNSSRINPAAKAQLDSLGAALVHPSLRKFNRFRIAAHTDARGNAAYNLQLSQDRADAVADYLIRKFSISPDRFEVVGLGETEPVDTTKPEGGVNRRVEIRVWSEPSS